MMSFRAGWTLRRVLALCGLVLAVLVNASRPTDAASTPLLMEGKRTLFQRVLSRPGAALHAGAQAQGVAVPAFSVLFVYARKQVDGDAWVQVGSTVRSGPEGWMLAKKVIDWKQTMTVAFTNPAGRNRLALFKERKYILELLESEMAVRRNNELIRKLAKADESGELRDDLPAISIEPATYVDFSKNFYLLPILEAEEVYFADGFSARLLKIASVSKSDPEIETRAPKDPNAHRKFKTAITFVVDATSSMGPYLDQMRSTVERVYGSIAAADLQERVAFGLVGFRDNTGPAPGLDYVSKVFADLRAGSDADEFLDRAKTVQPATVSSQSFNEDTYAGVVTALNELDWSGFGGRYIVVITDAAPRDGADPLSTTGLNGASVRALAKENGVAVLTLHLLTPEGVRNHAIAEERLSALSQQPNGSLYYGVPAGDARRMGDVIEAIATILTDQVSLISKGELSQEAFVASATRGGGESALQQLRGTIAQVGYAMQLAYLGRDEGAAVPPVFEAWVADRDVANPSVEALEVRLLLSKNQLSDLQEALKSVIYAGELGQISPDSFFDEIRSAAAALARDPSKVGKREYRNLGETGLLSEYLEGLPYRSKVMNVSRDLWLSWSIGEQQAFLDDVESKIRLYQQFHDDVDRWTILSGNQSSGEAVYPVPLDALP
jgi:serine/threonine-protein kinase PpkA